jgi:Lrp/AsnC family transcriptional regulator, leucine-responsive regulatory protein
MVKLDKKDTRVLLELEKNARQPYSTIGRKVRLSKQAVNYRINRLKKLGVISHFVSIVDTRKLGYTFYLIFLQFNNVSTKKEKEIIKFLEGLQEISWLVNCVGKWNLIAGLLVRDPFEVQKSLERILDNYSNSIKEKSLFIVVDAHPCTKKYLYDERSTNQAFYFGNRKSIRLKKIDYDILKELQKNSCMNNVEISRKIGSRHETVKKHIEDMIDSNLIQAFSIKLNPQKYGYEWHNILLRVEAMSTNRRKKFVEYFKNLPNVVFVTSAIGEWDFMLDLHVENQAKIATMLEKVKETFPNVIKNYESIMIIDEYKVCFIPTGIFKKEESEIGR